ncbi:unnamed protein product [Discosporangium mesarthrocarpum]
MIAAGSGEDCDALCKAHSSEFPTNNLGLLSWYTGCTLERDWERGTLTVTQSPYIDQLSECFDVCSSSLLPVTANEQTLPRQDKEEPEPECYRELIGPLLWVVFMSRLDVSSPVRVLARYSQDPSKTHWPQGFKILRYLIRTRTWGISYRKGSGLQLYAFADSYAGDTNDRCSVSGGAIMFRGSAVSRFSRTQSTWRWATVQRN